MDGDAAGYGGGDGDGPDAMPGLFSQNTGLHEVHAPGTVIDTDSERECKSGFEMGYFNNALTLMGHCSAGVCPEKPANQGVRRVRMPGVAGAGRTYQALIYPHGNCDVAQVVKSMGPCVGLVDIGRRKPDVRPEDTMHEILKDTTPFDGKDRNSSMPSGWYPGAKGFTRTFQQYYQLPTRASFWKAADVDLSTNTYLVVSGATWYYSETGDCETRVAVSVASLPYSVSGIWKERSDLIASHLTVAKSLADAVFLRVKQSPPSEYSVIVRRIQAATELRRLNMTEAESCADSRPAIIENASDDDSAPGPRKRGGSSATFDPLSSFDMAAR